jgi:DHA3 family macrolide efflux protein-like MFS transporter
LESWKKNIILFLTSQTISLFGSSLVQYAILWYITLETQSGMMMTISIICGFLPTLFLSPFAGVWADRYNRKTLIMLADAFIATSTLIVAIVFLAGYEHIWLLFAVSAVRSLGTAIQMPAVGAYIPQIVPVEMLTKVNATNASIQSVVFLVSPMVAAALLTVSTIEWIFMIDVVTAAIAIMVLLLFLHVPAHAKAQQQQTMSYFSDLKEGFTYIGRHSYIKGLFIFCGVFFLLLAPASFLTPLQVTRSFGADVWRLTAIEVLFSIGMIGGGLLMAVWGGFRNRVHTMTGASLMFGGCTLALGLVPNFWIYLAFMGLAGISIPFFNTPFTVLLQEKVDADMLGRVFGVLSMISSSMMPLGMLFFGPLADRMVIEKMLVATGVLICIEGLLLGLSRVMVEAGEPLELAGANEDDQVS